jgi:hypothetical protein
MSAETALHHLREIMGKLKLAVNEEKTRICKVPEGEFDFLVARSPYFVTRYPKASDISSPRCLLQLLPAGAIAGWDLTALSL